MKNKRNRVYAKKLKWVITLFITGLLIFVIPLW